MAEVIVSKEKIDFTIDLLITMVVDEISEETGNDRNATLVDFMRSKTGKALYDAENKLWCCGPSYIVETYMEEKQTLNKARAVSS